MCHKGLEKNYRKVNILDRDNNNCYLLQETFVGFKVKKNKKKRKCPPRNGIDINDGLGVNNMGSCSGLFFHFSIILHRDIMQVFSQEVPKIK